MVRRPIRVEKIAGVESSEARRDDSQKVEETDG
jgi:hypothetical protein